MNKRKKSSGGFSNNPKEQATRKTNISSTVQHSKENQAASLINQGSIQEAEAIYRELISSGTSNHLVYGNLAAICGMQGKFDELIQLLRKTLQLNPNYPQAHNNLGIALKEKGDQLQPSTATTRQ